MKYLNQSLTAVFLVTAVQVSGVVFAQSNSVFVPAKTNLAQTQVKPVTAASPSDPLAAGAEIFENLTESSPVITAAAFNDSMAKFKSLYPKITMRLSPARKKQLDLLVSGVRKDWEKGNRSSMAIDSIEIYRLLQESIDHRNQPVPIEVPLLDYAGFKLKALLLAKKLDWIQIRKTTQEAAAWWALINTKVTDKSLRDAMAHTVVGIKDASDLKDPKLLGFAAEMDLILVDGLEAFFNSHAPNR
ncbi:hypothetical protein [Thiobacillus sp.]